MDTAIIAAIVGGISATIGALGTVIVNIIRAKKEPDETDLELKNNLEKEKEKSDAAIETFTEFGKDIKASIEELKNKIDDLETQARGRFDQIDDKFLEVEGTNDDMIRNTLTHIYFKYKDDKKIPHYEKENMLHLSARYKGNSYVHTIIDEMKTWEEII